MLSYIKNHTVLVVKVNKLNLGKYHDIAAYLKKMALDAELNGRDYCPVDLKVLLTASAAMENLIMQIHEDRAILSTLSADKLSDD